MGRLKMLTRDEAAQVFADQERKNKMDAATRMLVAEERGMERGLEKGREEGMERGLERAALQMLKLGYALPQIQEAVNLPEERLRKLQKQSDESDNGGGGDGFSGGKPDA